MKIRIYSPYVPYPPAEGGFQLIFNQIMALAHLGHEIEVVVWKTTLQDAAKRLKDAPKELANANVRFRFFLENPKELFSLDAIQEKRPKELVSKEKVESFEEKVKRVARAFLRGYASPEIFYYPPELDLREGLPPVDLAIYSYSFSWVWLRSNPAIRNTIEPRQVIYLQNLESDLFRSRSGDEKSVLKKIVHLINAGKLDRHERELHRMVNELWFVSEPDLKNYESRTGHKGRFVAPVYAKNLLQKRSATFKARISSGDRALRIGFVGGLDYEPNRACVDWILSQVAPILKEKNFSGELVFVGKPLPGFFDKYPKYSFIRTLGFVPSLEDWWSGLSFLMVPHITGSGVRMKLIESVASGVPVLANEAAAMRVCEKVRKSPLVFISNDPKEWADKILKEAPFETRSGFSDLDMNSGLDEESVYSFLKTASHASVHGKLETGSDA